MPRHAGGGGVAGHPTKPKGGKLSRRTRGPSPYDSVYRRADWNVRPEGQRPSLIRRTKLVIPVPPPLGLYMASRPQAPKTNNPKSTRGSVQPRPQTSGRGTQVVKAKPVKR